MKCYPHISDIFRWCSVLPFFSYETPMKICEFECYSKGEKSYFWNLFLLSRGEREGTKGWRDVNWKCRVSPGQHLSFRKKRHHFLCGKCCYWRLAILNLFFFKKRKKSEKLQPQNWPCGVCVCVCFCKILLTPSSVSLSPSLSWFWGYMYVHFINRFELRVDELMRVKNGRWVGYKMRERDVLGEVRG